MVAEQREVYSILSEIFSADGNEMYVLLTVSELICCLCILNVTAI